MLVATLTETISAATRAGDLYTARVAHETLGRLLVEPEPGAPEVADLASERARRVLKDTLENVKPSLSRTDRPAPPVP